MPDTGAPGRQNQKSRTRKDILQAAARLMKQGRQPTLDEIAEEAQVSRATAYRYFPGMEALLNEAHLDVALPDAREVFAKDTSTDALARVERVDSVIDEMILGNEMQLRMMLAHSQQARIKGETGLPARQNRRGDLIDAALLPVKDQFDKAGLDKLRKALALIIGTESMVVFKDVLQTSDADARKVRRWAIRALVDAARR